MNMNSTSTVAQRYKLLNPCRDQFEYREFCLDNILPPDHRARAVWEFVEKMNIDSCFNELLSYKNVAGRSTTSPKVLLCLWIYSIMDGNISARKLEELCLYHDAYKWIAGGTPINRTMLSNFRSKNSEKFEDLLTSCLAVMVLSDVISDQDLSQDGTRVKANAGVNSFRTKGTLENMKMQMSERLKQLELEQKKNPNAYDARTKVVQERAIRERSERINQALVNLEESKKKRLQQEKRLDNHQQKKN
jgi:transposase